MMVILLLQQVLLVLLLCLSNQNFCTSLNSRIFGKQRHNSKGITRMNLDSSSFSKKLQVYESVDVVGSALCKEIIDIASKEIKDKNAFFIAVPGGSVLKLLAGLRVYKSSVDWSKVFLFYVNHKCVPNNDPTSTHLKAKNLFLDFLNMESNAFPIVSESFSTEISGHSSIAHSYQGAILKHLPIVDGIPSFDYMLLGMGKDGHIGSLYAGRNEVLISDTSSIVLPVDKKIPPSVTLSLPVMNNAKNIRVVLTGADKREALFQGLKRSLKPEQFPVCGLDATKAIWLVDKACAENLGQI